jgi:hypothetical protein
MAASMHEQQDKPMLWEMIKLTTNPPPNFMAVRKSAIMVSKTRVYKSDLMAEPAVMRSVMGFIKCL